MVLSTGVYSTGDPDCGMYAVDSCILALQMDPQICRVIHYGIQHGMGMTAVTLAALLTSGMRMFFHKKGADPRAQDLVNRRRAELMDPQVMLVPLCSHPAVFCTTYRSWKLLLCQVK